MRQIKDLKKYRETLPKKRTTGFYFALILGEQPKAEATVFESVELFDGDQFIPLLRFLGRFFGR